MAEEVATDQQSQAPGATTPIAHVVDDQLGTWRQHRLDVHLRDVATRAASFAAPFGSSEWTHLAGLWHDLGKYRPRFQHYIRQASGFEADAHIKGEAGRAPHSTAGALLACDRFGEAGRVLAYLIAGHHAGLYDWHGGLNERMNGQDGQDELRETLAASPPADILDHSGLTPELRDVPGGKDGFALWVRLLFSCLVDADFLDTESFMDSVKAGQRGQWPDIPDLLAKFDRHMATFEAQPKPSPVNHLRAGVLKQCRERAGDAPGLFSLSVPTGGGKTLSGMAFALEHAKRHGKRRVIHVIPYTSIIEQTANIFRGIFGDAVIEHHSNAEADPGQDIAQSRLACENWDAPIVVTTNVQFFESLFAARTSRCRKLHNIVNSVVILDEAQLLPPEFLQPILDVLNLLARHYGVTVVLSTATQPALSTREYFDRAIRGLEGVREIVTDPDALFRAVDRVTVRLPDDWNAPVSWDTLAKELVGHECALAVVNTRRHARELHRRMPKGTLHLSALMCGAHRADVIARIKVYLKDGIPTRVVSTQLVEAGVDLDFPVVFRALAGLDSIAQAAGRCNREGNLERGEVVVFVPPEPAPPGLLRKGADTTRAILHGYSGNPLDRVLFARYFERLYHACELDKHGIGKLLEVDGRSLAVNFRTASERFRLIDDEDQASIIVRYRGPGGTDDTVDGLIGTLRNKGPERWLMRKFQRYTVSLPRREALRLLAQSDLEEVMPGLFFQRSDWLYDSVIGFVTDGEPLHPASTIV
ncbi:MAG: CRISPR-associated helicase Cas3' [Nitrospirae bacterium]|nr:CRISPR-associated helicase Cas3' [Nitrospirota bacterium]